MLGPGGLNIQQLPKDERFLRCFIAREGHTLIDTDFTSLENVVLAEHSRDKGLMELYGSGKPHDSYLFVACFIFPESGIAEVYKPNNPTKESVAQAKKQFKKYRNIAKVIVLASNYGAGAFKIHLTLTQAGVNITLDEVKKLHERYWELFSGIKRFEKQLRQEWEDREGYFYNGVGRAIVVPEDFLKDIVNRFCQSTGVGLLHRLLWHINKLRAKYKVPMWPWIVDFHDQTTWEVTEGYETQAERVFREAYALLNSELDAIIPLKGDIDLGNTLWEFKK